MSGQTEPTTDAKTKLPWYDQVWLALPFALVAVGGAIGGACGGAAWGINQKVFRATKNPVLRYVWTGLISMVAVVLYFVLAIALYSVLHRNG
jgi:hypothetical protein